MIKKTILLTAVGRRDYLVHYFKEISEYDCKVIVCNSIADTTAMWAADKSYIAPPFRSEEYIPFLLELCKNEKVDILISLFDLDTLYIANHKKEFEKIGVLTIISDPSVIHITLNKIKTNEFLRNNGIKTPDIYTNLDEVIQELHSGIISLPLVLKPQWGQGSTATEIVTSEDELIHAYYFLKSKIDKANTIDVSNLNESNVMLIQEFIKGEEYGIDIINNLDQQFESVIIKKKYAMRSGETDAAITVFDEQIGILAKKISDTLRHVGILDVDLIKRGNDLFIIDMNPRFGGGYPFSHQAGANIPKAILQWSDGEQADYDCFAYNENVFSLKGIQIISRKINKNSSE
jgi:carbamoyl-phosphate synthase large subunit